MRFSILISFFFFSISIFAQKPKQLQSSEIFEAIKKLNGQIQVESEVGQESTFTIKIPNF